jgi:hypothetical protein
MRKFKLMSLSGPFSGSSSYAELNECGQQIGFDAQKGPPKIKHPDLAYMDGTNRCIANDEPIIISTYPCKKTVLINCQIKLNNGHYLYR